MGACLMKNCGKGPRMCEDECNAGMKVREWI